MRRLNALLVAALLVTANAWAQGDPTITNAVVTNAKQLTVVFSEALTTPTSAPQFDKSRVRLLPDNVTPADITQNSLARNTFALTSG